MRQAFRIFLFVIALAFLESFAACSGTSSRPVDADGILGNKPKYFYNHVSSDRVLVVIVDDITKQATLYTIIGSVITNTGSIAYQSIHVTQDGKYLTIVGQNPIFELNAAPPTDVAKAGFVLPATSIDTLCFSSLGQGAPLGASGFSEVRSYIVSGGYSLVAVSAAGPQPLLSQNAVASWEHVGNEVNYLANGVGLHIQEQSPNASDPSYFASYIDAGVSATVDWASAKTLICHLNLPPVPSTSLGLTSIYPTQGSMSGNTLVTLSGTGFAIGAAVTVGAANCTSTSYVSATTLNCFTPAGVGAAQVKVTNPSAQTASLNNAFTFVPSGWTQTSLTNAPSGRLLHTAVWTGTKMIVWGGSTGDSTGGMYDPITDTWTAISTTGAPTSRTRHSAVWTGSKMIVWGGNPYFEVQTGGVYDPSTDTWKSTSLTNAPSARWGHSAVWTGSKMIVWGGRNDASATTLQTGASYDPMTDTWTPMSMTNAPISRWEQTTVWTGSKMIIWGGIDTNGVAQNSGGIYDPARDVWTSTNLNGAPFFRYYHSAVWTGSKMIIYGGTAGTFSAFTAGGIYDPDNDSWSAANLNGGPTTLSGTAIWTGSRMLLWNGVALGMYNPSDGSWLTLSTTNGPVLVGGGSVLWTGSKLIIWGGGFGNLGTQIGAAYVP